MNATAEPGHRPPYHRLLIGFNHHIESRNVLTFAVQVAEAAQVELAGVFVEDQELLDMARLPFSTEILFSSRQTRSLEARNIESDLRALANAMHKALDRLAGAARRQCSFRTVRGHVLRELMAQAGAGDLVLICAATATWRHAAPPRAATGGPVVLLRPPAGNGNLTGLAREIARLMGRQLVILDDYQDVQALCALNAGLIIAPGESLNADRSSGAIERLADAVNCPVLIVPAS